MYDVIVVGARVAGASTALLFAQAGYRVLLVDRARFPSDTLSTHYIHQPGIDRMARWGVLDAVRATGLPLLERTVYQVADVRLDSTVPDTPEQPAPCAPRRHLLDSILIDAAVAAGAEFREGFSISGPLFEDGRVVGVEHRSTAGVTVQERARLVVGADGMRSTFARGVGAGFTVEDELNSCIYYTYWEGIQADFELYEQPGRWVGAVPTNDGATLIAAYRPQDRFDEVRADALANYLDNIRITAPDLFERAQSGSTVERLRGTGDQQNFFRQASGPGWALVGDAAHHKDSITARGISDAFLQADLLAESVGSGLQDPARLDRSLAVYAERHQDELFEGYRNTLFTSRLEVQPERLAMLRAIQQSPFLTERYFAAAAGSVSVDELYVDELYQLMDAASA
ncbi:NAD(P)/FAD-dependent oxidoreductase [Streptacidiphilus cavernicola]|uniref:NAD(P)/FAD-dependent oxidoreductase n=1 Tax=Streptacidiphilus cavernicola TaxID=3342716 RepID=A0ABV6VQY7_9ACTN